MKNKTNKKPKRTQVSLRREVYEKLKAEAKKRAMTMPQLLEEILKEIK